MRNINMIQMLRGDSGGGKGWSLALLAMSEAKTTLRGNVSGANRPHSLAMWRGQIDHMPQQCVGFESFSFLTWMFVGITVYYTVFEGLLELRYAGNNKYKCWAAATYTCRHAS